MRKVAYVVMEEEMFRLRSVFAREMRNESALRSVWVRGVDNDRILIANSIKMISDDSTAPVSAIMTLFVARRRFGRIYYDTT